MPEFDKDKPAGATKLRLSDDHIRENNDALEDAIGRDHQFPTGYGTTAGKHTVIQLIDQAGDEAADAADIKIWNNAGDLRAIVPGGTAFKIASDGDVTGVLNAPAGTEMIFIQDAAPTGWTRNAARQDGAMLVYAAAGAVAAGGSADAKTAHTHTGTSHSHDLSNHTHTGPSHTHTGPSHTHTLSHYHAAGDLVIPNHTHTLPGATSTVMKIDAAESNYSPTTGNPSATAVTGNTGYNSHDSGSGGTGATGAGGTGATGAPSSNATSTGGTGATGANSAPYYQEVISCVKD
jgi:hypothetical protein